jgi:carbonic anhydrase
MTNPTRVVLFALAVSACGGSADHAGEATPHWAYSGSAGPENWGGLDAAFRTCSEGKQQSPIDVTTTEDVDLPPLAFDYRTPAGEILHNGHSIQVPLPPGNTVTLEGRAYALKQFHFHAPSEHRIQGRSYPLELHLVHADTSGALLVVGVMFERGGPSVALAHFWAHVPPMAGETRPLLAPLNPAELLPPGRDSYRLAGSLTTPPCSERVQWVLLSQPLTASAGQLELLAAAMGVANNRPVQPLHDRVVYR